MLVTTKRYWRFSPFWSPISTIVLYCFKKCHNIITNTWPTSTNRHRFQVTKITNQIFFLSSKVILAISKRKQNENNIKDLNELLTTWLWNASRICINLSKKIDEFICFTFQSLILSSFKSVLRSMSLYFHFYWKDTLLHVISYPRLNKCAEKR